MRNARLAAVASLATALLAAGCGGAKKSAAESSAAPASGGTPWVARHGLTAAQYQTTFTHLVKKGYRLKTVSGYTSGGAVRYAALWVKQGGPAWAARHGLTSSKYQAAFDHYKKTGYRLTHVSGYAVGGAPRFAAIWQKTSGPAWQARHNLTAAQYQQTFEDLKSKGYRLRDVSGYAVNGKDLYAAIWDKSGGPGWVARHGLTAAQYQQAFDDYVKKGYRLELVSGYNVGGTDLYAALWEKSGGPLYAARHGVPGAFYQDVFDNLYYQGYQPVYVNGFASGSSSRLNAIWENTTWKSADLELIGDKVAAYMTTHSIPGLALAITKDGRLVYAGGFGLADKSTGQEASPTQLFRIASVSKPITPVAVMRLLEQGKLTSLDLKVFGPNSILGSQYATPDNNTSIESITVRQLLQHISGFTTKVDDMNDPMFQHTDYSTDELINWALKTKAPINSPGSVYEYSNFGYKILGRVIAAKSGQSYEDYVRSVLASTGVTDMVLAANAAADRKPHEVVYYPSSAYDLNVNRFDAHGGWLASAIDLTRFMVRVDGLGTKPDIVNGTDYTTMTTKSGVLDADGVDPTYAFGWVVGGGYQWHNGCMTGTIALMGRAPSGITYSATVNTRPSTDPCANKLRQALDTIVGGVSAWPAYDLF
ncbi:MAG TPA: serine hydrolase [Gaiellaceae bacterium]|jgi:CubicO group peptidase (beta-lactamase class C family)|nr:serine hydrolase [Gaiellaceae bacterium]